MKIRPCPGPISTGPTHGLLRMRPIKRMSTATKATLPCSRTPVAISPVWSAAPSLPSSLAPVMLRSFTALQLPSRFCHAPATSSSPCRPPTRRHLCTQLPYSHLTQLTFPAHAQKLISFASSLHHQLRTAPAPPAQPFYCPCDTSSHPRPSWHSSSPFVSAMHQLQAAPHADLLRVDTSAHNCRQPRASAPPTSYRLHPSFFHVMNNSLHCPRSLVSPAKSAASRLLSLCTSRSSQFPLPHAQLAILDQSHPYEQDTWSLLPPLPFQLGRPCDGHESSFDWL